MRKITSKMFCVLLVLLFGRTQAQLSGSYTVTSDFPTLASAIASLNAVAPTGPVTINIPTGYTETPVVGGFVLTATGTSLNPITFKKDGSGVNPLLIAYTGTATPSSAAQDGVFRLIGSDYITIDGIDISDPNASNPATMEFGYGFFKQNNSNGCQNNIIKNCIITLNRINNAVGSGPAADGSRGIDVVNTTNVQHTTSANNLSNNGANSNNKFYSNLIQNCNICISIFGFADTPPYSNADFLNDIGGSSAATTNTFINYGGATSAANPASAVRTANQYSINISNNYIYNNDGSGVNHSNTLRGIYLTGGLEAVSTVNNNTIILTSGGTTQQLSPIENASGSGAAGSVTINNNLITNCAYPAATSGPFYGIYNNGVAPTVLSINGNTFTSNSTAATSGFYYSIYNTGGGATNATININANVIGMGSFNAVSTSLQLAGIYNSGGSNTAVLSVIGNTLQGVNFTGGTGSTGTSYFVFNGATQNTVNYVSNILNNISLKSSGACYLFSNDNATPNSNITSNIINTGFTRTVLGTTFFGYYNNNVTIPSGSVNISANNFSNITLTGGAFYGIYHATSINQTVSVTSNTISGVNNSGTGVIRVLYLLRSASGSGIINNIFTNFSGSDEITGIYGPNTAGSDNLTIQANTLGTYTSTGAAGVNGIFVSTGNNVNVAQNKIYDLQISNINGSVIGINITAGTLFNIYNNMIGDLRSPIGNSANPVIGISLTGGTTHNVFYNTVNLNAVSSGANFGSSAINVNIAQGVTLLNNIFINNSTPNGTGKSVAYRRNSTSLTNYAPASNNNIFYAGYIGVPSTNKVIFFDGFNAYQTLSAFQSAVSPREALSLTENTPFMSTVGTNTNFLHIDPILPSGSESGAVAISTITTDFDSQTRQSTPDIGADEYIQNITACSGVTAGVVSPSTPTVCAGSTSTITLYSTGYSQAGGITYTWQVATASGGPYSNVTSGTGSNTPIYTTPSVVTSGTYYYVMVATCSVGAISNISNTIALTVMPMPTISISASSPSLCSGITTTLTASGAGVSGTYTWTPSVNTNTYAVAPSVTTTYSVVGTSSIGCNSDLTLITVTVVVTPSTAIVTSPLPAVICSGASATLTGNSTSATNWDWLPAPLGPLTTSSVVVSPTITTTYTLTRDVNGDCVDTETIIVTVNSLPAVGANVSPLQLCAASQATIFGSSAVNYTLNTGSSMSPFAATIVVSPTVTTTYTVMGVSSAGCYSDAVITLTVLPTPTITVDASPTVVCQSSPSTLSATAVGAISITSYTWMPSVGNQTQTGNPVVYSPTVATTYSAIGTGGNGCNALAVIQVSVRPVPILNATTSASLICFAKTATLNATTNGNGYSWDMPGSPSTQTVVSPITTTIYNVTSTFVATGCQTVKSVTVNVFNPIFNSTPSPTTVCKGSTITLSSSGANTYTWVNNPAIHTPTLAVSPTVTTNYTISATSVSNNVSCKADNTIQLIVYNLPTVTVVAERNPICQYESAVMTSSGAITYTWTGGLSTGSNVSTTLSSSQIFTVTGFDVHNCHSKAVIQISVAICPGFAEIQGKQFNFDLFPNPSNGLFTVRSDVGVNLSIINEVGQTVKNINLDAVNDYKMDVSDLASGIYFIIGNSDEGIVKKKIVISR